MDATVMSVGVVRVGIGVAHEASRRRYSLSCRCRRRRPPQTDSPEQVLNSIEPKQHDVDLGG